MTETEILVQDAISKICDIDPARLHPDAKLADLGVDSLAAAEVLVEVEIRLGQQFPVDVLRQLDDADTVRAIAAGLESAFGPRPRRAAVIDAAALRAAGTSPAAIANTTTSRRVLRALARSRSRLLVRAVGRRRPLDELDAAQQRKLDFFATALGVRGGRVLDIGCGWGALLDRFVDRARPGRRHRPDPQRAQAAFARAAACRAWTSGSRAGSITTGRCLRRHHLHRGDRAPRVGSARRRREGRRLPRVLRALRRVAARRAAASGCNSFVSTTSDTKGAAPGAAPRRS